MAEPIILTDANLDSVLRGKLPAHLVAHLRASGLH